MPVTLPDSDALDMVGAYRDHHVNPSACHLAAHLDPPVSISVQFRGSNGSTAPENFQD